jgi:branched-chain amino acid transport system permease protein
VSDWYFAHLVLIQSTFIAILTGLSVQVPVRTGVFSFAGIGSYTIGAYATAIAIINYDLPAIVGMLVGAAGAAVIGLGLAYLLNRLSGLYLGMCTIAFVLILGVIVHNAGDLTGGSNGLYGAISNFKTTYLILFTVAVLVLLALSERGRLGRRIDVVREDPELAASMGVSVARVRRVAFVVSGILGACAGGMNALVRTTVAPEDVGFSLVVLTLTIIIVGGSRSWAGVVIGAVIFTWLPTWLEGIDSWKTVIYGVLVTLAAVWVPDGILGLLQRGWHAVRARSRPRPPADPAVAGAPENSPMPLATTGASATTEGKTL